MTDGCQICMSYFTAQCWGSAEYTGYVNGKGDIARFHNVIGEFKSPSLSYREESKAALDQLCLTFEIKG